MAMKTLSETIGTHAGGMEFHAADGRKHKVKPLTLALLSLGVSTPTFNAEFQRSKFLALTVVHTG